MKMDLPKRSESSWQKEAAENTERYEWWNDEEMMAELDRRYDDLRSGKDPGFTLEESMARLKTRLKKNG